MHTLTQWKARRAGGRITINGRELDGDPGKIVGVDVIEPRGGLIIATDKNGVDHRLIV
jgi:hypothetical protein